MGSDVKVIPILKHLATRGWVPLRSMSYLLGYAHPVQIYQRQHTKQAIACIVVGRTNRVYEEEVLRVLNDTKHNKADAELYISMYNAVKNQEKSSE